MPWVAILEIGGRPASRHVHEIDRFDWIPFIGISIGIAAGWGTRLSKEIQLLRLRKLGECHGVSVCATQPQINFRTPIN